MGKPKNKDERNGDIAEENAPKETKKGKKGRKKDVDWENDVADELEKMTLEEGGGESQEKSEPQPPPVKKEQKKNKKSKAKDSDDDEEVIITAKKGGGFAALMMDDDEDDNDDSDVPVVEEKKKAKKKTKPSKAEKSKKDESDEEIIETKKGGGFAALMADEDDDCDDEEEEKKETKKKNKKEEKPKPVVEDKKKGKKGKKNKKEEEDLDQILAELQLEYQGDKKKEDVVETPPPEESSKKKKKKKKEASVEPDVNNVATPSAVEEEPQQINKEAPKKEEKIDSAESKNKEKKEVNDTIKTEETPKPEKTDSTDKPAGETKESSADKPEGETPAEPSKSKKKKKKAKDKEPAAGEDSKEGTPGPDDQKEGGEEQGAGKKKGKKKKEAEEEVKSKKGKPGSKALAAMREMLAKQKEEEERLKKEEEERIRLEEERIRQEEEEIRLEQERKERKKQKEKDRKERLKAEGKLLTPKQKADKKRAEDMLKHLRAQGLDVPEVGERKPRPGTRIKPKKVKKDESSQETEAPKESIDEKPKEVVEKVEEKIEAPEVKEEEVKDSWDISSEEEEEEEDNSEATVNNKNEDEDNEEESEEEDSEDEEEEERVGEAEKRKQKAIARMMKRKEENLKKLDVENLRAPVVCVLGHVDHGKTKILDKLRKSNVQEGEVGGITQQIGATNVPSSGILKQTHMVKEFNMDALNFPGLLIIDTPGHESFRNLRSRGSSLCDIAILVVDITQGLEPQTRESISLLRQRGTPFMVALNKVDRVYEWISHPSKDIRDTINLQDESSINDFERRTEQIIQGLREEKLNSALFWKNPNPKEYISLVPTSAISGDGMGNLMSLICMLCQNRLKKGLMFSEELQCTVLEVKTIQGHGTTIDVILVNGRLREGDTIIVAGTEGPIVTQIRSLLLPKPMKEIRVKGQYDEVKEIKAAQGVKIAARDLEKAIPGLSLKVAYHEDEVDIIREEVDKEFNSAMRSMKVKERGVYVQASTLGALEALLEFFKTNNVPYSGIRVGPVVKRDVMRAAAMLEHDPMYAVILAFDVKVEKDAQDLADKEGVKIFSEETIYHLGDRYVDYLKDYKKKKQDEFRHIAVFPSRLRIIPTAIFNKRDPIVLGVHIEAGILRTGTPLCVPSKEFVEIGIVTSLEFDHKNVDSAKKGDEVCIKIENVPGHTPKLFGRHFEAEDQLVSKISRESINACKDYFRDDLGKGEWKLMIELKKQFQIL